MSTPKQRPRWLIERVAGINGIDLNTPDALARVESLILESEARLAASRRRMYPDRVELEHEIATVPHADGAS